MLFNNIGDEVVMMDIEQGAYYGLEKVAARIWNLTEHSASVSMLCDRLAAEYDVPSETCRTEVTAFLGTLVERGIVNVVNG
jgi:trimethylamine:corrinoid methyltransferase-like protein